MQGRLETQLKIEKRINVILEDLPKEASLYYLNIAPTKEFRTCMSYIRNLKKFLIWYSEKENILLQKIDFSKVSDSDIAQYLKSMEIKQDKDGNVTFTSFSYRKQLYSILHGFFGFLYAKKFIDYNPVSLIEPSRKKDKVEHIFLQSEDVSKIIQSINNGAGNAHSVHRQEKWKTRDLAIVYMFTLTGMRESALCEIDLNKIDLENNSIEVIDKEHKHNTYNIIPKLKEVLLDWLEVREKLLAGESCDALFISNQRKRINPATVRVIINKYSESAFGYKVSPHRLRAYFGNTIYKETHDIELTSRAMKHENITTTRIYMEDDEQEVNNRVADILGNKF